MNQENIITLIKSNLLLNFEQKNKLLAAIDSASFEDIKMLEIILNSSNQKLKDVLHDSLNSDNINEFLYNLNKIKSKINSFEEKNMEEKESLLEDEILSKIEKL